MEPLLPRDWTHNVLGPACVCRSTLPREGVQACFTWSSCLFLSPPTNPPCSRRPMTPQLSSSPSTASPTCHRSSGQPLRPPAATAPPPVARTQRRLRQPEHSTWWRPQPVACPCRPPQLRRRSLRAGPLQGGKQQRQHQLLTHGRQRRRRPPRGPMAPAGPALPAWLSTAASPPRDTSRSVPLRQLPIVCLPRALPLPRPAAASRLVRRHAVKTPSPPPSHMLTRIPSQISLLHCWLPPSGHSPLGAGFGGHGAELRPWRCAGGSATPASGSRGGAAGALRPGPTGLGAHRASRSGGRSGRAAAAGGAGAGAGAGARRNGAAAAAGSPAAGSSGARGRAGGGRPGHQWHIAAPFLFPGKPKCTPAQHRCCLLSSCHASSAGRGAPSFSICGRLASPPPACLHATLHATLPC